MEVIYRLNKWTSSNQEWLTIATAECLVCQNGDQHSAPSMVLYSIVIMQPAVWQLDYIGSFPHKRATICSCWNRFYSLCGFAFPLLDCSSKSTRCGPMDDLVTVLAHSQWGFFFVCVCEQGANQTKYGNGLMIVKFSVSPCSLLPWEIWFGRCVEMVFWRLSLGNTL